MSRFKKSTPLPLWERGAAKQRGEGATGQATPQTHSVQFPYIREGTGYTSISRNTYFFLLPLVGLNPHTARDLIEIRLTSPRHSHFRKTNEPVLASFILICAT